MTCMYEFVFCACDNFNNQCNQSIDKKYHLNELLEFLVFLFYFRNATNTCCVFLQALYRI